MLANEFLRLMMELFGSAILMILLLYMFVVNFVQTIHQAKHRDKWNNELTLQQAQEIADKICEQKAMRKVQIQVVEGITQLWNSDLVHEPFLALIYYGARPIECIFPELCYAGMFYPQDWRIEIKEGYLNEYVLKHELAHAIATHRRGMDEGKVVCHGMFFYRCFNEII